jgi:hypothetical protein
VAKIPDFAQETADMKPSFLVVSAIGAVLMLSAVQIAHTQSSDAVVGDGFGTRQPANINLTRPPKPVRDPNGLYQFGEKIAVVEAPKVDLAHRLVHFATIRKAPTLNVDADFEYQNYVLHYEKAGDELIVGGAVPPNREFADVVCKIVGVKE